MKQDKQFWCLCLKEKKISEKRSAILKGQTILMPELKGPYMIYERGHTRSMLKKEKEKKMPTYVTEKTMLAEQPSCAFEDEITDFLWSKANTAESLWDFQIFGFKKKDVFQEPLLFSFSMCFFNNTCCVQKLKLYEF